MSLSLDLRKIKSPGIYRYVYDKSQITPARAAETRLFVGYSNKGPFNTPVYADDPAVFEASFGKASKKLEKRGIFFHRLCEESIPASPILALNVKPFTDSHVVSYLSSDLKTINAATVKTDMKVTELYDTNRFWVLDPDQLPSKITGSKYFSLAITDEKITSCSVFIRKASDAATKNYDITFREWFAESGEEIPDYIEPLLDANMKDYFAEVYVFKGKFTKELCGEGGVLAAYFDMDGDNPVLKEEYIDVFGEASDALYALADDQNSNFLGGYCGITLPYFKDLFGNYISIDLAINADYSAHKLIAKLNDSSLDNVSTKDDIDALIAIPALAKDDTWAYVAETSEPAWASKAKKVSTVPTNPTKKDDKYIYTETTEGEVTTKTYYSLVHNVNTKLAPQYFAGYTYDVNDVTIDKILDFLKSQKGLRDALTNRVDCEWRYLVDTFAVTNLTSSNRDKSVLAGIVKKKDNALGLINLPAMKLFADQGDTYKTNGVLDPEKIVKNFTLPTDANGASWCAYFTPFMVSDGTVKSFVPSAGAISNNFMEKFSTRHPYDIVAGPTYGVVSATNIVGPDYNYSKEDRDVFVKAGWNVLSYELRYGVYVDSNETAKRKPASGLSKIHIRDLVIYLQDEIEDLLRGRQWEKNTDRLRRDIKSKADVLLEIVKANEGVYNFSNQCNEKNNDEEVIENSLIVLDTEIEPAYGAESMVQRLTIRKTGTVSSQG